MINICLLLAAGTSSRFSQESQVSKQLYLLNNKPVITYSIDVIKEHVQEIIIVTNSKLYQDIDNIINTHYKSNNIKIIINNINDRLESIKVGLEYINNSINNLNKNINNIIVHEAARPFIRSEHISKLLESNKTYKYSQYCMKLVNGLCVKIDDNNNYKALDRNIYLELCTPVCCEYNLYYDIFMNYIMKSDGKICEHIDILNDKQIKYNFIDGHYKDLKKITYYNDLT